ncbi:hypothetical protein Pst134EA_000607 [Puccinia striiformis f. sp. tritici]|uniref:hypothetical protein n=1 Tax=Puccinia striiformis f. sp. tritici TaxID=168172 RepID=UPI002008C4A4|nr:hypothetical protein Pst134EA_000607 [Puccinia striiformis f. sp. tritici]KAH9473528.1 hypothetical protein Pst134EA_000607 [Puccinia striiformis f. sp. tritici]KAI9601177.1 hypothetical protein H4Q26_000981 [Puccinia striiformis f. sp. tritici PST-130]
MGDASSRCVDNRDSNQSEKRLAQELGDSVSQKFITLSGLSDTFNEELERPPASARERIPYIDQLKSNSERLQSSLLPLLEQQLDTISTLLNPSVLRKDPLETLQLISELQFQLDDTLQKIRSVLSNTHPKGHRAPDKANDKHLEECKQYRTHGLHRRIREGLLSDVTSFCHASYRLIMNLGFTTLRDRDPSTPTNKITLSSTSRIKVSLQSVSGWLTGSEWDTVLDEWRSYMDDGMMDSLLDDAIEQARSIAKSAAETQPMSEPLIESKPQIGELWIPIMKLSRLFFAKLIRSGLERKSIRRYTDMNSYQLHRLNELALQVCAAIHNLNSWANVSGGLTEDSKNRFIQGIKSLVTLFQTSLLDILLYVIPGIPDADYLQAWLVTWNTQLVESTHNIIKFAENTNSASRLFPYLF